MSYELLLVLVFDKLDDEYMPGRHAGFTGAQTLSDFMD